MRISDDNYFLLNGTKHSYWVEAIAYCTIAKASPLPCHGHAVTHPLQKNPGDAFCVPPAFSWVTPHGADFQKKLSSLERGCLSPWSPNTFSDLLLLLVQWHRKMFCRGGGLVESYTHCGGAAPPAGWVHGWLGLGKLCWHNFEHNSFIYPWQWFLI